MAEDRKNEPSSLKPSPTEQMSDGESAFHLQEYSELRQEIILNTEETRKLERYCLIAAAFVFAWVATEGSKAAFDSNLYFTAFMPTVLIAFGWMKSLAIEQNIGRLGKYISVLEKQLAKNGRGWEQHYEELASAARYTPEKVSNYFWPSLFLASVFGGVALIRGTPLFPWLSGS